MEFSKQSSSSILLHVCVPEMYHKVSIACITEAGDYFSFALSLSTRHTGQVFINIVFDEIEREREKGKQRRRARDRKIPLTKPVNFVWWGIQKNPAITAAAASQRQTWPGIFFRPFSPLAAISF